MEQILEFQVSGELEIEPEKFIYAVLIEPNDNENDIVKKLEQYANQLNLKEIKIKSAEFIITSQKLELEKIKLFECFGKQNLHNFIQKISPIDFIKAGIVKTFANTEQKEIELINSLIRKANGKAEAIAKLIDKNVIDSVGLKIIPSNSSNWSAYPPFNSLDRNSIYQAIMMNFDKKDSVVIAKTIEIKYKIR